MSAPHSPGRTAGAAALEYREAVPGDAPALVALRDSVARALLARGIEQWRPGEKDAAHFVRRMREGEVWLAHRGGTLVGAYELWWSDEAAWGPRPADAGYVHRLMTAPGQAPPGTGRALLAHAESRVAAAGRPYVRLDCLAANARLRAYYESCGYAPRGLREPGPGAGSPYTVALLEKRLGQPS